MKIMITGANGQLGQELQRQLAAGGSVLGPMPAALQGAAVAAVDMPDGNLADMAQVKALMERHVPDVVVNCAAFTNVDGAEADPGAAFAANALAPRNLAMACEAAGAKLVHLSTDYVFGGAAGLGRPFAEYDTPAPLGVYGRTKLQGEDYVKSFCSRWFIVRTAWLYSRTGHNFVKTMQRLGAEKDEIRVVDDQLGNPTNAEDLAHHLLRLLPGAEFGLYHCTGGGTCSWHQLAAEVVHLSGGKAKVLPCTTAEYAAQSPATAPRPPYSPLDHAMLRATVGDDMRPWQAALQDYYKQQKEDKA